MLYIEVISLNFSKSSKKALNYLERNYKDNFYSVVENKSLDSKIGTSRC